MRKYSLWVCVLLFIGYTTVAVFGGKWHKHTVIKSDAAGYYVYLPASIIYKDILKCKFYWGVDSAYNFGDGVRYYAVQYHPTTKNFYFKYNYGVALMEAPLFFVAHAATLCSGLYPADGYSDFYQLSVACSTVLFGFLGLLVLRRFLLSYFNETVVAVCLLIIGAGTNYFAQIVTQPGISHVYAFFLFALLLYAVRQVSLSFDVKWFLLIGIIVGLIFVTRPIDILIVIFPILWIFYAWNKHNKQLKSLVPQITLALIATCSLVFIQLLYWKFTTGHWFFYTYKREHFIFNDWQILNGLFSFRKGWFVYTPLAFAGFIGCYSLWKRPDLRFYLVPFSIYFVIMLYITFCWWQWYYGGSFGCRVLVESYTLLALPLCALIEDVTKRKRWIALIAGLIFTSLIFLNVFQTAQYAKGIIHWQKMNKEYYWRVFGKWNIDETDKELLLKTEEITQP